MKDEKYISKKTVIDYLLIYLFLLIPMSIFCFIAFFITLSELDLLFISFPLACMGIFILIEFFLFLKQFILIVIKKQSILEEDFYKNIRWFKFYKKNDNIGIHGIIEGKEFDEMDKDGDDKIVVSEFYPLTETEVLNNIRKLDSDFSKSEFYSYVKSVFFLIRDAFIKKDNHMLRAFEEDGLYWSHKSLIENNQISDKNTEIRIKGVLLKDFKLDGNKQIIDVAITIRIIDKTTLDADRFEDIPLIMVFARNGNFKINTKLSTTNCLNCGAVIDVDDKGICKYCGTSLVSGDLGWVLTDLRRFDLINKDISNSLNNTMQWMVQR